MTAFLTGNQGVEICPVYAVNAQSNCGLTGTQPNYDPDASLVVSFTVQAGQPIGYYTFFSGGPITGTYGIFIVLEQLD